MSVQLKVIAGPHEGKEYRFQEHDNFIVGRTKPAHFQLGNDDLYFSRVHFMVEVNPPVCRMVDLGSRNGTRVNGQRLQTADLKHGDVIGAGRTQIQVSIELPAPAPINDPVTTPTIITEDYGPAEKDQDNRAAAPSDSSGLELLPGDETPVHDPHGYLPTNYLKRIEAQPQYISGYQLVQQIGQGGMGTVFLAIRESDRSIVAVKTIRPGCVISSRDQQRFLREAQILQQLIHPNIVACKESGECDGLLYFAMEYVPGRGADALARDFSGKMPVDRAVRIVLQLLKALRYAHAEGFVHRDIKPSNLLIVESESGDLVKLADFGLARAYQASGMSGLTMTGEISGTVGYMSPEQICDFRRVQPTTDQYAAAATLYHLLTGKFVFDFPDDPGRRLLMILDKQPVPIRDRRPEIPENLAAAIHRALSQNSANRFPDVRGFHAAILPFATANDAAAKPQPD